MSFCASKVSDLIAAHVFSPGASLTTQLSRHASLHIYKDRHMPDIPKTGTCLTSQKSKCQTPWLSVQIAALHCLSEELIQ